MPADQAEDTIFGKILRKEIPSEWIYEDEHCIAFRDINPVAPVHCLVIPKRRINQVSTAADDDAALLGNLLIGARNVARQEGLADDGYRIVINDGKNGCQTVYHLHLHVIGGKQLGWPPC